MGLTRAIGEFTAGFGFRDVPADAVAIVHTGFTDCVGVMLAGLREPVARIVIDTVAASPRSNDRAAFLDIDAKAPDLALAYGTAAHAHDYDDVALSGHPSAVLVPAILAEAHEVAADGRAMIAAYVAGYEIWADLIRRDADQHHAKGWHPSATFGTIAAAGASAVLRGLDADVATNAMGIAASLAGGVAANFGTMTKPFQVGRAAQSGLLATRWAEAGITASPDAIEHEAGFLRAVSPRGSVDVESEAALGTAWRILTTGVNVKLYPICYGAHRALDAMIDLCRADPMIAPADIEAVQVELGETQAAMLRHHAPRNPLDAKFSLEFAVAAGAIAGRCGRAEMAHDFVQRNDVQGFFAKVEAVTTSAKDPDDPAFAPFDRVRVVLDGGRECVSAPVFHPRGHFKRPIERDALFGKFRDCASAVLAPEDTDRLFATLQNLRDVASIAELAHGAASRPSISGARAASAGR
jgi:2-methylcitrate dehydratase PrpD